MIVSVPLSKSEIVELQSKISFFIIMCSRYDSVGRIYVWSDLHRNLNNLLSEEEIHNFEFPSSINPSRDKVIKELEDL